MMKKVICIDDVSEIRSKEKNIIFTNGCFDILHAGHVGYLRQCKNIVDNNILVVGINSDYSVYMNKGQGRPINTLENRIKVLEELISVDYIISFNELTPSLVIEQLCPKYLVKGNDYDITNIVGSEFVLSHGGFVITIPIELFSVSTSSIIKKIKQTIQKNNEDNSYII